MSSEVARDLRSDVASGLTPDEAARRLSREGPNRIRAAEQPSLVRMFLGQFESVVIWVLIGAAVVSIALGEIVDGTAILTIVFVNAIIGFLQEYRADRAVAALARMTAPRARVVRDGQPSIIPAEEVVLGWLLLGAVPFAVLELRKLLARRGRGAAA